MSTPSFKDVRAAHGFTEYDFQGLALRYKNAAGFSDRIGSHVALKLGSKVFGALEQHLYGLRGRPRLKGARRPLHSLEGKDNTSGVRFDRENLFLVMSAD